MRCPHCGYVRPVASDDHPAFHKPGCKTRRLLQRQQRPPSLKDDRRLPIKTIAGASCQVVHGLIVAAIDSGDPPQRWMAQA